MPKSAFTQLSTYILKLQDGRVEDPGSCATQVKALSDCGNVFFYSPKSNSPFCACEKETSKQRALRVPSTDSNKVVHEYSLYNRRLC